MTYWFGRSSVHPERDLIWCVSCDRERRELFTCRICERDCCYYCAEADDDGEMNCDRCIE